MKLRYDFSSSSKKENTDLFFKQSLLFMKQGDIEFDLYIDDFNLYFKYNISETNTCLIILSEIMLDGKKIICPLNDFRLCNFDMITKLFKPNSSLGIKSVENLNADQVFLVLKDLTILLLKIKKLIYFI